MLAILLTSAYAQPIRLVPAEPTEGEEVTVLTDHPLDPWCEVRVQTSDGVLRGLSFPAPAVEYPQASVNIYATFTCERGHQSYAFTKLTVWDSDCPDGECLETESPSGGCGSGAAAAAFGLLPLAHRRRTTPR